MINYFSNRASDENLYLSFVTINNLTETFGNQLGLRATCALRMTDNQFTV